MRTVFFGTPDIAIPTLDAVATHHEVTAVVCQPDKPQGRSKEPVAPPVKIRAQELGLPVHQPQKLNDGAFEAWLREQAPEVCTVAAYGRLLKQPLLDLPPHGWLNLHPSLLPRYRGPSPIRTAILNGDSETGVTIMKITLEMDAGDILLQEKTPIGPDEDNPTLSRRLAEQGAALMLEALELVAAGKATFTPQNEAQVTVTKMFQKEDGRINWGRSAGEIHNLVRAAQPWPVAHCLFRGKVCRIHRSAVLDAPAAGAPGEIVAVADDALHVATGEGQLGVLALQAPGKRTMLTTDFLRGARVKPGERFEGIA